MLHEKAGQKYVERRERTAAALAGDAVGAAETAGNALRIPDIRSQALGSRATVGNHSLDGERIGDDQGRDFWR